MNIKNNLSFGHFAQSIVIIILLSILIFGSSDSHVKGQNATFDPPFPISVEGSQAVIEGDGIVPGGPGFIMISPVDFKPFVSYYPWAYSAGVGLFNPSTISSSGYVAGLTLPHHATIKKMTLYYKDSHVVNNLSLYLYRGDGNGAIILMSFLDTTGDAAAFRYMSTTQFSSPVVDNQTFSYFLYANFPGNVADSIVLTNVRIDYQYTAAVPLVMN